MILLFYFYTLPHDSGIVFWFHVGCPCVCPSVCQLYEHTNGHILGRHELGTCACWVFRHLVGYFEPKNELCSTQEMSNVHTYECMSACLFFIQMIT